MEQKVINLAHSMMILNLFLFHLFILHTLVYSIGAGVGVDPTPTLYFEQNMTRFNITIQINV